MRSRLPDKGATSTWWFILYPIIYAPSMRNHYIIIFTNLCRDYLTETLRVGRERVSSASTSRVVIFTMVIDYSSKVLARYLDNESRVIGAVVSIMFHFSEICSLRKLLSLDDRDGIIGSWKVDASNTFETCNTHQPGFYYVQFWSSNVD